MFIGCNDCFSIQYKVYCILHHQLISINYDGQRGPIDPAKDGLHRELRGHARILSACIEANATFESVRWSDKD